MTRVNLSLVLCVTVGFSHNKHDTFHIRLLGYWFVFIFWILLLIRKGVFVVPTGKAEFVNKRMNLQSRSHGPQFKLLRLK